MTTRPPTRSSTLEEVADAAGVSVATVSRALRGLPNVAPSTRQRVEEVAEQLNYRADPSASRLAMGRTTTVAMAVPVVDSWYFSQVMAGSEAVLSEAGYDLLVFAIGSEEKRRSVLSGPLVKRADGLIVADLRLTPGELTGLAESGVRVVTIGSVADDISAVVVDDFEIGRIAGDHLLGLGHRHIGLIQGVSEDPLSFPVPLLRRDGFLAALDAAGVETRPEQCVDGNFSVSGGGEAMHKLLSLPQPPTAVFAISDEMAFGALQVLRDRGIRVPDEMSVIGVDNHDLAPVMGLTTIDQDIGEHGPIAARLMLDHLADPERPSREAHLDVGLVQRASTGPPPANDNR